MSFEVFWLTSYSKPLCSSHQDFRTREVSVARSWDSPLELLPRRQSARQSIIWALIGRLQSEISVHVIKVAGSQPTLLFFWRINRQPSNIEKSTNINKEFNRVDHDLPSNDYDNVDGFNDCRLITFVDPMAMATSAAMSQVAKKAGTLVVVVMKAVFTHEW